MIVPAEILDPKSKSLSWETAAALPGVFTTVYRVVVTVGYLKPAEIALIFGARGGDGHAALQFAEMLGATVYATTSTVTKSERVRQWPDEVTDYTEVVFDEVAMYLTDSRGFDLAADHLGQETWQQSINSLAMGGRVVICGATSGPDPNLGIRSVYQHHRQILGAPMESRQDFRDAVVLVARKAENPLPTVCLCFWTSRRATAPSRTVGCSAKAIST